MVIQKNRVCIDPLPQRGKDNTQRRGKASPSDGEYGIIRAFAANELTTFPEKATPNANPKRERGSAPIKSKSTLKR